MNRGILLEGLGSILTGLGGAGHATTSYSGNIGFIKYTGVILTLFEFTLLIITDRPLHLSMTKKGLQRRGYKEGVRPS